MFVGMLLGLILTMRFFPDTPIARAMHRAFVERPLAKLADMSRAHLIFGVIALVMLFSSAELIMLLGSSDLVMLMAWDVSLYVDAVIAVWTVAAVTRLKGAWRYALGRIAAPFRAHDRAPRAAGSRPPVRLPTMPTRTARAGATRSRPESARHKGRVRRRPR